MLPLLVMAFMLVATLTNTVKSDNCPLVFQRFSKEHSICLIRNPKCEILSSRPSINGNEIEEIKRLHNLYRSIIAQGQEALPPAANMMEMEWDNDLAAVAQNYAEQCIFQHDCMNCRRVKDFGVGQNIAMQKNNGPIPSPDWSFAVSEWYSEKNYFPKEKVCPFGPPLPGGKEFRHFSQIVWAGTFRIGCGYVLHKEGNDFVRLYVCNYGPMGNIYDKCMYEIGSPCSHCPMNTCCGNSCPGVQYPALCKRLSDSAPIYPPPSNLPFFCDFRGNQPDCLYSVEGNPNWLIESALEGNYLSIVLNGGDTSAITFFKPSVPASMQFCVTISYRKGPNIAGDAKISTARLVFSDDATGSTIIQDLTDYEDHLQFGTFSMSLSFQLPAQPKLKISFSVPPLQPAQFFHLNSISATNGICQN